MILIFSPSSYPLTECRAECLAKRADYVCIIASLVCHLALQRFAQLHAILKDVLCINHGTSGIGRSQGVEHLRSFTQANSPCCGSWQASRCWGKVTNTRLQWNSSACMCCVVNAYAISNTGDSHAVRFQALTCQFLACSSTANGLATK